MSSAPTSQPLERPMSCKVSRVWLQGVSRACSGLVSGLVGWQKARHLVTRHSVPAEPWVSRLITPCNTAPGPSAQPQRPPAPPAREPGLTRAGAPPPRFSAPPPPQSSLSPEDLAPGHFVSQFLGSGPEGPSRRNSLVNLKIDPAGPGRKPLPGSGQPPPRRLDPVTLRHACVYTHTQHTHTAASSQKRCDAPRASSPEVPCPADISSTRCQASGYSNRRPALLPSPPKKTA